MCVIKIMMRKTLILRSIHKVCPLLVALLHFKCFKWLTLLGHFSHSYLATGFLHTKIVLKSYVNFFENNFWSLASQPVVRDLMGWCHFAWCSLGKIWSSINQVIGGFWRKSQYNVGIWNKSRKKRWDLISPPQFFPKMRKASKNNRFSALFDGYYLGKIWLNICPGEKLKMLLAEHRQGGVTSFGFSHHGQSPMKMVSHKLLFYLVTKLTTFAEKVACLTRVFVTDGTVTASLGKLDYFCLKID